MKSKFFLVLAVLAILGFGAIAGAGILTLALNATAVYAQNGTPVPTVRDAGILVGAVTPGSPTAKAGIVRGDIILEANGKTVNQPVELNDILNGLKVGDTLVLSVLHGDTTRSASVTLADQNGRVFLGLHPAVVIAGLGQRLFGGGIFANPGKLAAIKGALVTSVSADGPAAKAGLQAGDQILSVNGKVVDAKNDLAGLVQALKPGDTAVLSVQKKGASSPADVKVTLGTDPSNASTPYLGLSYTTATLSIQNGQGPKNFNPLPFDKLPRIGQSGVYVGTVTAGSPADKAGVKTKDLITTVNGKSITTPDELTSLVKAANVGDVMTLTITRAGEQNPLSIRVTLEANPDQSGAPYLGVSMMMFRQLPQQPKSSPTPKASGANF